MLALSAAASGIALWGGYSRLWSWWARTWRTATGLAAGLAVAVVVAVAVAACGGGGRTTITTSPQTLKPALDGTGPSLTAGTRGGTLTVLNHQDFQSFDPGQAYFQ